MKTKNKALLRRFESFVQALTPDDRVAVVHHTDPDGVASAVLAGKIVEKARGKGFDLRLNQKPDELFVNEKTYNQIKKKGINKLVITDLSVDQYPKGFFKKLESFCEILIVDHHKLYKNLNSGKTTHIKPQMLFTGVNPSKYCAAKLVYDLGSNIFNLESHDWIAVLGIIGDSASDYWEKFVQKALAHNKLKCDDVLKSPIGRISQTLFYTESYNHKKVGECFEVINNSSTYKDALNSKLDSYRKRVVDEIKYWTGNVRKFAEFYPEQELIFDYIKPRYSIRAAICSSIGLKFPNSTIIIAQDMKNDFIQLSARRMDSKIPVNDLLEKTLRKFKGANGGGHVNSAGGRIRKEDLHNFKNSLLDAIKKSG